MQVKPFHRANKRIDQARTACLLTMYRLVLPRSPHVGEGAMLPFHDLINILCQPHHREGWATQCLLVGIHNPQSRKLLLVSTLCIHTLCNACLREPLSARSSQILMLWTFR